MSQILDVRPSVAEEEFLFQRVEAAYRQAIRLVGRFSELDRSVAELESNLTHLPDGSERDAAITMLRDLRQCIGSAHFQRGSGGA